MKANELMIGDWVTLKSNGVVPDAQVRIEEIAKEGIFVSDCDNLIGFDEIEPIPLTEEILKANDIPVDRASFFFNDDKHYELELTFLDGTLSWTINCAEYDIKTFRYVHELQHALRLCGLNELADNFKIE